MRKFVLVFGLMLATPSNAQQVYIEGTVDCGQWIEARTHSRAGYLEHYVLGLLNGMVLGRSTEFWRADG